MGILEASEIADVCQSILRRWEQEGKIKPERTAGGTRRYTLSMLKPPLPQQLPAQKKTIANARVSSHDQKEDLEGQLKILEMYCSSQGWQFETDSDLDSGMNYRKRGLKNHSLFN